MRIITGTARGAKLKTLKGLATRPTADRVKESVFNILGGLTVGARVLDLFAGTGNLGLEAISRGAARAVFVDQSAASARIIRANAAHVKFDAQTEVFQCDARAAVDRLEAAGRRFELIFCDPPYNAGYVNAVLQRLDCSSLPAPGCVIVLEHARHEECGRMWKNLQLKRARRYGETMVGFFLRAPDDR